MKVLLAYVMTTEGLTARMDINVAYKLLVGLSRNLRDTDYLGWYRDGMIVGAVLTALTHDRMAEVSLQVERRCLQVFQEVISSHERSRIQFRVCHDDELECIDSGVYVSPSARSV